MRSKVMRAFLYLIYIAVFGFLMIKYDGLNKHFQEIFRTTFQLSYMWFFIMILLRMLIGLLLALPQFVRNFRPSGRWKVDWLLLVIVGLPSLCIAVTPIAQFALRDWSPAVNLLVMFNYYPTIVKVAGILCGFTLLSSFRKQ